MTSIAQQAAAPTDANEHAQALIAAFGLADALAFASECAHQSAFASDVAALLRLETQSDESREEADARIGDYHDGKADFYPTEPAPSSDPWASRTVDNGHGFRVDAPTPDMPSFGWPKAPTACVCSDRQLEQVGCDCGFRDAAYTRPSDTVAQAFQLIAAMELGDDYTLIDPMDGSAMFLVNGHTGDRLFDVETEEEFDRVTTLLCDLAGA